MTACRIAFIKLISGKAALMLADIVRPRATELVPIRLEDTSRRPSRVCVKFGGAPNAHAGPLPSSQLPGLDDCPHRFPSSTIPSNRAAKSAAAQRDRIPVASWASCTVVVTRGCAVADGPINVIA